MNPADPLAGPRAWAHVMYALHAASLFFGMSFTMFFLPLLVVGAFLFSWPSIIAMILNYLKKNEVEGTWLASHYRWQRRTFWFALAWLLLGGLLTVTFILIPLAWLLWGLTALWLVYRIARGWLALCNRRPLPVPAPL